MTPTRHTRPEAVTPVTTFVTPQTGTRPAQTPILTAVTGTHGTRHSRHEAGHEAQEKTPVHAVTPRAPPGVDDRQPGAPTLRAVSATRLGAAGRGRLADLSPLPHSQSMVYGWARSSGSCRSRLAVPLGRQLDALCSRPTRLTAPTVNDVPGSLVEA